MKISILLPVFNAAPFLPECLDSILAQTEQDWELLAADDFSTDESLVILTEYAKMDHRIQAFPKSLPTGQAGEIRNPKSKKGIAPALRLAFQNGTGPLVTRMDADDRMMPGKLAALKKLLLENGQGHVATGLVKYFSAEGVGEGYRRYAAWLNGLAASGRHFDELYKECVVPSPCWMAWRDDLVACGAFVEDTVPEDYDLCFRLRQAGLKMVAAKEVLHLWRDHPGRTSRTDALYLDNSYLELKTDWFLRTDYRRKRPLVLWGAGRKGKRLAKLLAERGVPFRWVCNNPGKWGHLVGGVAAEDFNLVSSLPNPQVIIAVAGPDDQEGIRGFLGANNLEEGKQAFFFC